MSDNLKLLGRDWPTRQPKYNANQYVALAIGFAFVDAVYAALFAFVAKRHGVVLWQLSVIMVFCGIALPWFAAVRLYKQVKAALVASGASPEVLAAVRYYGALALHMAYTTLTIVLIMTTQAFILSATSRSYH